jgi:hypothetical protein
MAETGPWVSKYQCKAIFQGHCCGGGGDHKQTWGLQEKAANIGGCCFILALCCFVVASWYQEAPLPGSLLLGLGARVSGLDSLVSLGGKLERAEEAFLALNSHTYL